MAYQVLHTEKCNKSACKGTEIHNERKITGENVSEYQSHTNENIDPNRTHLNVALVGDMQSNYYQIAKQRITDIRGGISPTDCVKNDEGKVTMPKLRKDAVWTADTVISASPEFFKERFGWDKDNPEKANFKGMNEYFQKGVEFMQLRYGKDNVIGAIVHYDETTPHLHVHWTPIQEQKLSYKALSSPMQLKALQTDFNAHIRANGYELERGEVDSKKKHLTQQTEKLNIAIKENDRKLAELERIKSDYEVAKNGSHALPQIDPTKSKAKDIQNQNEALRIANRDLKNRLATVELKLEQIKKVNADWQNKADKYYAPMENIVEDFKDKNTVYVEYLTKHEQALEQMKPFESEYIGVVKIGETMVKHKKDYVKCTEKLHETNVFIAEAKTTIGTELANITHIAKCDRQLDGLRTSLDARREQLERLQGKILKGKDKKALQNEIEGLNENIGKVEAELLNTYGLREYQPYDLQRETKRHQNKIAILEDKAKSLEQSIADITAEREYHEIEYRYQAVKNKSLRKEWQSTIERIDKRYQPPHDSIYVQPFNINRLSANERVYMKDRLKQDGLSEKSKAYSFVAEQDPKSRTTELSRGKEKTQSKGWDMER